MLGELIKMTLAGKRGVIIVEDVFMVVAMACRKKGE